MTEQTNAELIATAKAMREQMGETPKTGSILALWFETAERLEAADQQKCNALCRDVEQERDQYAAVVEKVRGWAEEPGDADEIAFADLNSILATAPEDALRELKADVWDEGLTAGLRESNNHARGVVNNPALNPYREEQS